MSESILASICKGLTLKAQREDPFQEGLVVHEKQTGSDRSYLPCKNDGKSTLSSKFFYSSFKGRPHQ